MESRLQKFAALIESGSFSRAAQELHISQPALSVAIRKLERELQASLFIQGSRPIALTESGRLAYRAAKEINITTSNLRTRLAELAQTELTLRVGMIDSVANAIFSQEDAMPEFSAPATLSVMVDNSRVLTNAVEHDTIDLAFIAGQPRLLSPQVTIQALGSEPLVLVCATSLVTTFEEALKLGELPQFVSYDQRSNTYHLIQETLHRHNITVQPSVYSTSPEVTLHLVRQQQGSAVLPYHTVRPLLDTGELSLLGSDTIGMIARPISMVQRRDKLLPKPAGRLTRQVRRALVSTTEAAEIAVNSKRT
jgi:DNA-binding transcriptional LysR family regulator